jgi:DNA-binding PadR family transcriptional regulator
MYQSLSMSKRGRLMPAASLYLLLALLGGENHGYALMQLVEEQSDGAVRMGPGTLYGTLNRLLQDGLIIETTGEGDAEPAGRRRYYRLTAEGDRVARTELERLRSLVSRFVGIAGLGDVT